MKIVRTTNSRAVSIICDPRVMARILALVTSEPEDKFAFLINHSDFNPRPRRGEVHLFRHGAKLCRPDDVGAGPCRWYILSYADSRSDMESALNEVKAGYELHTAERLLKINEKLNTTPAEFQLQYRGLWGIYKGGQQRGPSELNYSRVGFNAES
jgi:hypothetical protein